MTKEDKVDTTLTLIQLISILCIFTFNVLIVCIALIVFFLIVAFGDIIIFIITNPRK